MSFIEIVVSRKECSSLYAESCVRSVYFGYLGHVVRSDLVGNYAVWFWC